MTADDHARLTELFGEAVERDPAEQRELVSRVAATSPELASALASLLELDRAPDPGLERALGTAGAPEIPGFEITGVLGTGGMGTVYAATQQVPRRRVAIKILHARSAAAVARFSAEAEILARLDHPGIAKLYQVGQLDGRPYLVLEYVDGATLDAHVRDSRPALRDRLQLMVQVCDAVHHAHVHGVIHRDLKPSNVIVRGDGRAVVLDFGIARANDRDGETRAGELVGTPVYMSPEQARLRPELVDARSDVYALGVVLYELIAGRLPYDVRGLALPEIARQVCETAPLRLGRVARELRGDLEAIADHALVKEPERRYHSAAALADDLRRYLAGRTVSVRAPGTFELARRFARRRPWLSVALAAAGAAAVALAAVITSLWLHARDAERAALHAKDALAAENLELELERARAELARDPTAALAMIHALAGHADRQALAGLEQLARGLGVARDAVRAGDGELRWAEPIDAGSFVTADYDGRAELWTGGAARTLVQAAARVHVVRPSPDGARFLVGGDGGMVEIVDRAGRTLAAAEGVHGTVRFATWSADGRTALAGSDGGEVWVWRDGGGARVLRGPTTAIRAVALGPDGAGVAAGDDRGHLWWWELATGTAASAVAGEGRVMALHVDERGIVSLDQGGALRRWRVIGGALAPDGAAIAGPRCKIGAIDPAGRFAVTGGDGGDVVELVDGEVRPLGHVARAVRTVAVSADGRWVAAGSDDGVIHAWNLATGRRLELRGHTQRLRQLVFSRTGSSLVSADSGGFARRWELDAIPASYLEGRGAAIVQLAVSPDGATAWTVDDAGELRRWSLRDGSTARLDVLDARATALAATEAGPVTALADGRAIAWTAAGERRELAVASAGELVASRDGRRLATTTAGGAVALLDRTGAVLATWPGPAGGTTALAISADGTLVAAAFRDRLVRVWRAAEPAAAPRTLGPIDLTRQLRFARGGTLVVTAGDDGKVRIWPLAGGEPGAARIVAQHPAPIEALAVERGGRAIVSIGRDRSVARAELDGDRTVRATPIDDLDLAGHDARALLEAHALGGATRGPLHVTSAVSRPEVTVLGTADGALAVLRPVTPP